MTTRLISLLLLFCSVQLAQADIYSASQALARGDYDAAASEFKRLAEDGDAKAQAHLGYMYYVGEGVQQSYEEAVKWYRKAAVQGDLDAQYNLAVAYAFGEGTKQNYKEAALWYRRAAEQGHSISQYSLGVSYSYGEGVPQDSQEAAKWFRKSAEQGYVRAQVLLGSKYHVGDGVNQDYQEAVHWYRMAADRGDASAQYNLGSMFRSGKGVKQDYNQALRWYRLAADQGYAAAQNELASLERAIAGAARSRITPQIQPAPPIRRDTTPEPEPAPTVVEEQPVEEEPQPLLTVDTDDLLDLEEEQEPVEQTIASVEEEEDTIISSVDEQETPVEEEAVVEEKKKSGAFGFLGKLFKSKKKDIDESDEIASAEISQEAEVTETDVDWQQDDTASEEISLDDTTEPVAGDETEQLLDMAGIEPTLPEDSSHIEQSIAERTAEEQREEKAETQKRPGFFSRLFSRKNKQASEEQVESAEAVSDEELQIAANEVVDTAAEVQEDVSEALSEDIALEEETVVDTAPEVEEAISETSSEDIAQETVDTAESEEKRSRFGFFKRLFKDKEKTEEQLAAIEDGSSEPAEAVIESYDSDYRDITEETSAEPETQVALVTEDTIPEQEIADISDEIDVVTEEPASEIDTSDSEIQEEQESKPGFFGRLFGKKDKTIEEDSSAVSDYEQEEVYTEPEQEEPAEVQDDIADDAEPEKEKSGGFFKRLFGKSKKQSPAEEDEYIADAGDYAEEEQEIQENYAPELTEPSFTAEQEAFDLAMNALNSSEYGSAFDTFSELAEQGDAKSQTELASLYYQGLGTSQDYAEALYWYERAAKQGNADAQYSLGNMFLMGEGVEQSDMRAGFWYEKAAEQGHDAAGHNLSNLARVSKNKTNKSEIVPGDPEAVEETTETGEVKEKKGFFGRLFGGSDDNDDSSESHDYDDEMPGSDSEFDAQSKVPQQTDIDEQFVSDAQSAVKNYELGLAYSFGEGARQDYQLAFEAFMKSAELGYPPAQYKIGAAYAFGEGVEKNPEKAVEWYLLAANGGYAIAQRNLGAMYFNGNGVEENKAMSLAWYSILADSGNVMDARRRDELEKELSWEEIQQAQKLKRDLLKNIR